MVEIVGFKNFEQFQAYIKAYGEDMPKWSMEKQKKFADDVVKLCETSPEFKQKYDLWCKKIELQVRAKNCKIQIGGSKENEIYAKAYLKLKEIQKKKKQSLQPKKQKVSERQVFEI